MPPSATCLKKTRSPGHVVIRSTDTAIAGSQYKLWTTLKVPQGYSIAKYADFLAAKIGAEAYRLMPAKHLFALGVGHIRRKGLAIGSLAPVPAEVLNTNIVELSELDWQVLTALKREFEPDEITRDLWSARADEAGVSLETFSRSVILCTNAASLAAFPRSSNTSNPAQATSASPATTLSSTGLSRKAASWKRAARWAGSTL